MPFRATLVAVGVVALSTIVDSVHGQELTFTATQITRGTKPRSLNARIAGPDPPAVTAPVPQGTYSPSASVVVSGTTYPPPSYTGMGRRVQLISSDNFCLLAPPDPTKQNLVDAEADAVAYCLGQAFNDTRPMPDYFIETAHFRRTPDYVQISGTYQWTRLNINPGDSGGEYDNKGPSGQGNPVGADVAGSFQPNSTSIAGAFAQFMGGGDIPGYGSFCLRACTGENAASYCQHQYDLMGCLWTMPGDYTEPGFTDCDADSDLPIGVYNSSYTFYQGDEVTPPPVAAPSSSNCRTTTSPSPSGVTYTFAQLQYESGYVAPSSTSSGASGSRSVSGSGSTSGAGASQTNQPSGGRKDYASDLFAFGGIVSVVALALFGAVLVL
ncbi:hypothetical protein OIO90_003872 [Microbotryomycetes sp. JL221]|nr:hypothetical protein OIO90_003872 [Microbotryomycetes sp. JL221]